MGNHQYEVLKLKRAKFYQENGHDHLQELIDLVEADKTLMIDFVAEISRGLYKDSDVKSYVETITNRARAILKEVSTY